MLGRPVDVLPPVVLSDAVSREALAEAAMLADVLDTDLRQLAGILASELDTE
ncbi:hypothetical protein [Actinomyces qiguomingii]|uniref:hypothetical protein n=1 Tax=Actinomyces qiguomingii TaxID=2057800 RepID=UPI001304EFB1|nr:hypothetical protein [Actinomyces qiguomingii]